ncbi:NFACT family protein [bacterium]|nr:NFACT family protein [bacterium]
MAMDGLNLHASLIEMQQLIGGKIDKVQQPERDELLLGVHTANGNFKLLLSASAANTRAHLTQVKRTNPADAPMFCMLLRKRIAGGKIISVDQPNLDRVLVITIEAQNDLGDLVPYQLISEIMGKHSNIVLVNERGMIVDAIRHVGVGMSNVRLILPGLPYELPPQQAKKNPLTASETDFALALSQEGRIDKRLSGAFFGLAPAMAAALAARVTEKTSCESLSELERSLLAESLFVFYRAFAAGEFTPTLAVNEFSEPIAVYPFVPAGVPSCPAESIGAAFDAYCAQHDVFERMQRHGASVRRVLQNNIERCEKKLALYAEAMNATESMERCRLYGELLTANMHALRQNGKEAAVLNYYLDPPEMVEIPLDPRFSVGDNAQRYYKKYQKMKAARDMAGAQREQALTELAYLEGQLDNLGKCVSDTELTELVDELREQGYLKREKGAKKPQKHAATKPMCFASSDGRARIYVGKNNRQNDALTLRFAEGNDIWLHTKNIPGSHVIIKCEGELSEQTLFEAAMLAAYYSRARGSENVPVDYTPRKYVKKPAGAKPGMVIYTTNRTAYVTPDEASIKALKPIAP